MPNDRLILASGRKISLQSLRQWAVYSGLIEGLPTREMNAGEIERVRSEARARDGHEPFLIEPTQKPIAYKGRYPFGEPASLPSIGCEAEFNSLGEDPLHYRRLTVIWFQHDYAFPLGPQAKHALIALDWEKLSEQREI